MNRGNRPLSVTVLGCVYLAVGTVGFAYHLPELRAQGTFPYSVMGVELVRLLAIVCGVFLLRGANWARWLAVSWIAFHVVVSAFHTLPEFAIHCVFCAVIAWLLFRPAAARYFQAG